MAYYYTPQCNTSRNFDVAGIKSQRREFKEARVPSEVWPYCSAKHIASFLFFFSRFNYDSLKTMEKISIPETNTNFFSALLQLKKNFMLLT